MYFAKSHCFLVDGDVELDALARECAGDALILDPIPLIMANSNTPHNTIHCIEYSKYRAYNDIILPCGAIFVLTVFEKVCYIKSSKCSGGSRCSC